MYDTFSYNEVDQLTKLDQEQYVYEYGWDREKEHLASKNKYLYTLNNPYKYVDRDGNSPSSSRTGFPNAAKGELAVRQIALSFTFMDFERNVLKFFNQKHHEDGKRENIKRKPFARTSDMSIIKLKAAPSKPFIGPFAWLLALFLDWGIDSIKWFLNLKDAMIDIAEWLVNQSFFGKFLNALGKIR